MSKLNNILKFTYNNGYNAGEGRAIFHHSETLTIDEAEQQVKSLTPSEDDLILRQDGDKWMCAKGDFTNLQESESWWGDTPEMALIACTTSPSSQAREKQ